MFVLWPADQAGRHLGRNLPGRVRADRKRQAYAAASGILVVDCKHGERKHRIAEEYLASHEVATGVFLILVTRAPARVWEIRKSASGGIGNIAKKIAYVNHYSFHIMDPDWGHVTIKMSGHPSFAAQVILNGHDYAAGPSISPPYRRAHLGQALGDQHTAAVRSP